MRRIVAAFFCVGCFILFFFSGVFSGVTKTVSKIIPTELAAAISTSRPAATPKPTPNPNGLPRSVGGQHRIVDKKLNADFTLVLDSVSRIESSNPDEETIVLWLTAHNKSGEEILVINSGSDAYVDGYGVGSAKLFGWDIDGQSIFKEIKSGKSLSGYASWDVPVGWEEFEFYYQPFWVDAPEIVFRYIVTPEDVER